MGWTSYQAKFGWLADSPPHTRRHLCATHATTNARSLLWVSEHGLTIQLRRRRGKQKFRIRQIQKNETSDARASRGPEVTRGVRGEKKYCCVTGWQSWEAA